MSLHYKIYSEGYAATGDSGGHTFHGYGHGNTFIEAVKNFAETDKEFKKYLRIEGNKAYYWGCRLFDNSLDASRNFG